MEKSRYPKPEPADEESDVDAQLSALHGSIVGINAQFSMLQGTIAALDQRTGTLNEQMALFQKDVRAIIHNESERWGAVANQVSPAERTNDEIEALDHKCDGLLRRNLELADSVESLRAGLAKLEQAHERALRKIAKFKKRKK